MKKAEECGPLGEIASVVAQLAGDVLKPTLEANPALRVILVVVPGGDVQGAAVIDARGTGGTKEEAMQRVEGAHRLLRDAAESCGRALFERPESPDKVAAESAKIAIESREHFEKWQQNKCEHIDCHVSDAATMIATGIRLLQSLGAPRDSLVDLTRMCKEACRRTHAQLLQRRTVAQA